MSDNDALLLAVLDRPGDAGVRLAYADWLEESGEIDLAAWLRVPARASPQAQRMHQMTLEAHHHHDWVLWGNVMLSWRQMLALFLRRLAEAVAWCNRAEAPVLRTPELLPQVSASRRSIEAFWRCKSPAARTTLVHHLAGRRARKLVDLGMELGQPSLDLAGGRLLLFEPDRAQGEAAGSLYSNGFIDHYQVPAWDTWLGYLDEGPEARRRIHKRWEAEWIRGQSLGPQIFASYLVAWVPGPLVSAVDWGCSVQSVPSLAWADEVDCALTAQLRVLGLLPRRDPPAAAASQRRYQRERRVRFLG